MKLDEAQTLLVNSKNLKELLDNINIARSELDQLDLSNLDLCSLPTFGGKEPSSTIGVFSWDKKNLLVGDGDFEIVDRKDKTK